jgi:hypothetical protein
MDGGKLGEWSKRNRNDTPKERETSQKPKKMGDTGEREREGSVCLNALFLGGNKRKLGNYSSLKWFVIRMIHAIRVLLLC